MEKRILIPMDFSEVAMIGAEAGMALAQRTGAKVYFLSILPGEKYYRFEQFDPKDTSKGSTWLHRSYKSLEVVTSNYQGVDYALYSTASFVTDAIERFVHEYAIDLVVMGSGGAEGLRTFLGGSHATRVVNEVKVPILVIKHPMERYYFKNIVFASDFRKEARKPFLALVELAKYFGAHLHLTFVNDLHTTRVEEYLARQKMQLFKEMCPDLPVSMHFNGDLNTYLGVRNAVELYQADLLAMVSHNESFWKKLWKGGSITEKVVNEAEVPVLALSTQLESIVV